jgi:hypothetical protein
LSEKKLGLEQVLRKLLPFTSVALVLAILYVGWNFFLRWEENHELEQKRKEAATENARKVTEMLGGNELKILNLSLDRGLIRRGEKLNLCYSVVNAKKVTIDPPPNVETWPSMQRCVEVAPTKNTKYTLTAEDAEGHAQTASVEVHVVQ